MTGAAAIRPTDLMLALLVIVVWGVNFAVIKVGVADVPPFLLGALRFMLAGFLLTVAAAAMWACGNIVTRALGKYAPFNQLAFVVWASAVAYLAGAATLLGYGLWTHLLGRYPANRIAPFTMLVPLVGLTTGWLVFGEALQPVHFAGGALLMLGLTVNVFGAPLFARRQWKT